MLSRGGCKRDGCACLTDFCLAGCTFTHTFSCMTFTLTAFGCNAKLTLNLLKGAGAVGDGFFDLMVGDLFANAYVHGAKVNTNENDCQ